MSSCRRPRAISTTGRHLHTAPLREDDVVVVDGLRVTNAARTIADFARCAPVEQAVVIGDALLRHGAADAQPAVALERMPRWPGVPAARRAMAWMDARSESVGESRSRVRLRAAGLPVFELQYEVAASDGRFLGRADFALPEHGVIGEFDGKVKYGRLLRPGQTAGDAVFREKVREDALRDAGWQLVRWTLGELDNFAAVAGAIRTGDRARSTGSMTAHPGCDPHTGDRGCAVETRSVRSRRSG
ncbi:hypothetical protein OG921_02245 [Aldersonia sp. NBC_00410]|uniref:hypothetical protein n=1 Tax=Aldersonia sp. NBC_00410 TaxID=2975954 RepID=UPI00224EBA63|nr:hypothetical protein [Aldersonia sp. NBC_00410]MCX5042015.1 hypothetical protein [Aldersonia sp. NBC_00410]